MSDQAQEPEPQEQEPQEQEPQEQEQSNTTGRLLKSAVALLGILAIVLAVVSWLLSYMKTTEQFNGWMIVFALISATCSCFSQAYDIYKGEKRSVPALIAYIGGCIAAIAAVIKVISLF